MVEWREALLMKGPGNKLLFLFIDGLGIGPRGPDNPLASFEGRILNVFSDRPGELPGEGISVLTDARLGVEGLPQSATGQTSLFTGTNAARAIGRHLQGFPTRRLKEIIASESLFRKSIQGGRRVTFANTYTPRFFSDRPRWISVTTTMCESAGVRLRQLEDLERGRGLYMDYTHRALREQGFDVPKKSPAEAAEVLIDLCRDYDLVLYEYFLTDFVGHRGGFPEAVGLLQELDSFLAAIIDRADLESISVLLSSDHGNIEDASTRLHTRNPVPTCVWGDLRRWFPESHLSLTDIAPRLVEFLAPEPGDCMKR